MADIVGEDIDILDDYEFDPIGEAMDDLEDVAINSQELIDNTQQFFTQEVEDKISKLTGKSFEHRKQQISMSLEVAKSFGTLKHLCIEAPTGVGKSYAYLIPSIYFSTHYKRKVLITTETIHLQEQLIKKDIPFLRKVMNQNFVAVLAKGRGNYICKRRLHLASGENRDEFLPLDSLVSDIERIARWADKTVDGTRSDIEFPVKGQLWGSVCSDGANCSGPKCHNFKTCFYWKARKEWDTADIIVANHALFFTDLKVKELEEGDNAVLPHYDAIVIDESHTLEDSAANHLGLQISNSGLNFFLNRVYDPLKGRGLMMKAGDSTEIQILIQKIYDHASFFFNQAEDLLEDKDENIIRILNTDAITDNLSEVLGELSNQMREYSKIVDDGDVKLEMKSAIERCDTFASGIYDFVNMKLENYVYWLEKSESQSYKTTISLNAAPLNVSDILYQTLFKKTNPVILTSATLAIKNDLEYYTSRIGFANGNSMILDSPFNFKEQARVYVPLAMPEPNDERYNEALFHQIKQFVELTNGKTFVLFTSFKLLKEAAKELKDFFEEKNISLLSQGEGLSRSAMLEIFRDDIDSVLFGTSSFWTGVDVPGEALTNVIITKFPFAVPTHPLIVARIEKIEKETGKRAFMSYSLPEAVLKFKQGIGRLIRSKDDTGLITILDKRVVSKQYGQYFLDSIPECPRMIY